ncbi:type II secretory pathway pseudopilin PulG [Sinomonas atrocyanea]|uniref:hypothetical protein n=1 Tax=Sinomonas atrocyanea TaxID=37927 RepID=UPI002786BFC8|nr:hypothetical protein [Sinomonas atrocyanea]MDP9882556.1 type II secretory pathway pseudopilin PulG [Sinomonas atrocyanea]
MAALPAFKSSHVVVPSAVVACLLAIGGLSVVIPTPSVPTTAVREATPVPDPAGEQRTLAQLAHEAADLQAAQIVENARVKESRQRAAQGAVAQQTAARQAQQQAAARAQAQAQAARTQPAQVAAAPPAPVRLAPAPAQPPSAFIPVVGAGGQASVDACQGPVRFTPVTVSISIAEHDLCGGWNRMSWIQPGTKVTVQGYGTFTAFARMVVPKGAGEGVLGGFAGGYPPIFLQTCIPGTSQMLLIALH